jgi:phage terminase small subunit
MGSRGRKSADERAAKALVLIETRRPSPPAGLTEAEQAVWRDVVGSLPAGWFAKAAWPLLVAYCRHVVRAEILAQQVTAFRMEWLAADGGLQRFDALLKMAERETRALTACARSLRFTPQSQMRATAAGSAAARVNPEGKRPWD